jgi:hypothetical protein
MVLHRMLGFYKPPTLGVPSEVRWVWNIRGSGLGPTVYIGSARPKNTADAQHGDSEA